MELIDKAALVAAIEKVIDEPAPSHDQQCPWEDGYYCGLYKAESIINTLEVKEADLENSMTCEVGWYDGFFLDYTQEQQDELLKKIGANVGDKIRIILVK